ncbi:zinc-binding dehydrogenase [Rhodopseudomonas sp. RCAM05734]|uniref:zinc-binding dehydrogenase n=1 Tax=Rhodopseudomonas sp. RCAM05734 TaxID=3457549 RepID=UPI004043FD1A
MELGRCDPHTRRQRLLWHCVVLIRAQSWTKGPPSGGPFCLIIRYSLNARSGAVPEIWNVKPTSGLLHAGPPPSRQEQQEMIAAIDANDIQPIIDSTFPLDQIEAAFRHQISQRHFGKICLAL